MKELEEPTIEELKYEVENTSDSDSDITEETTTLDDAGELLGNLSDYLRYNADKYSETTTTSSNKNIATGVGAGTTPTLGFVNANDTKGQINVTTGTTPAAGTIATITFNRNYSTAPIVILTPANAATAALNSGGLSITNGTISNNTDVAADTATNTVVTHNLGMTPTKITVSATVLAKGSTNADSYGGGTMVYNGGNAGITDLTYINGVYPNGAFAPSNFVKKTGTSFSLAGGSAAYETITLSLVSIGATTFTFRITSVLTGADPGSSTVTNITWVAEGSSSPSKVVATSTTTGFTISSTTTALTASTAYSWNYHCLE